MRCKRSELEAGRGKLLRNSPRPFGTVPPRKSDHSQTPSRNRLRLQAAAVACQQQDQLDLLAQRFDREVSQQQPSADGAVRRQRFYRQHDADFVLARTD